MVTGVSSLLKTVKDVESEAGKGVRTLENAIDAINEGLKVLLPWWVTATFVTVSGKTGLIAHSQVLRNGDFKYSRCCSLPMVVATRNKFSLVLQQSITFQILQ